MSHGVTTSSQWGDTLHSLDDFLTRAETLMTEQPLALIPDWAPPSGLGELPTIHQPRALALASRYQDFISRLEKVALTTKSAHKFAAKVDASAPASPPHFIDARS